MKHSILISLAIGSMVVAAAPAFASSDSAAAGLSQRFEEARRQMLNKLNQTAGELHHPALSDRFEAHKRTLNPLSERFEEEREQTLRK